MKATTTSTWNGRQLRLFVVLARTLNMRKAAAGLGLTTSAVSHGLKALEEDLGCALVVRDPGRLSLTPAGAMFVAEAERILESMESARLRVEAWSERSEGCLRVAASGSMIRLVLGPALREFRESFPGMTLALVAPPEVAVPESPGRGVPDLCLTTEVHPEAAGRAIRFGEDELEFYAHPLHPWVIRRSVDRNELTQRPLILPQDGTAAAASIRAHFREEGVTLRPFVEVADESAAEALIQLDLGVGILPRWLAAPAVRQGTLAALPLGRRRLRRAWSAVPPGHRAPGFAAQLLVDLLRDVFQRLSPSPGPE
jgi:DNA-binding transcriptional LysR family regulator